MRLCRGSDGLECFFRCPDVDRSVRYQPIGLRNVGPLAPIFQRHNILRFIPPTPYHHRRYSPASQLLRWLTALYFLCLTTRTTSTSTTLNTRLSQAQATPRPTPLLLMCSLRSARQCTQPKPRRPSANCKARALRDCANLGTI